MFQCPKCEFNTDKEAGWKRHFSMAHGPYSEEDLRSVGIQPTQRDIARTLDSGHTSIDSVVDSAPESESDGGSEQPSGRARRNTSRSPRMSKEEQQDQRDRELFEQNREGMVRRWKRRLRVPYSLWARLADDPQIQLSEEEVTEGAEMHVDFCAAMGWYKAGKVEAIFDLTMWHGATILSRSQIGQQLMQSFNIEKKPEETVQ